MLPLCIYVLVIFEPFFWLNMSMPSFASSSLFFLSSSSYLFFSFFSLFAALSSFSFCSSARRMFFSSIYI
tara:strand:- start:752 stop:961 length:210 start_codon:yes stop_codon:yes gene_type:complete